MNQPETMTNMANYPLNKETVKLLEQLDCRHLVPKFGRFRLSAIHSYSLERLSRYPGGRKLFLCLHPEELGFQETLTQAEQDPTCVGQITNRATLCRISAIAVSPVTRGAAKQRVLESLHQDEDRIRAKYLNRRILAQNQDKN